MSEPYQLRRGATYRFLLAASLDQDVTGWTCEAALRRLASGQKAVAADAPIAAEFVASAFAGDDDRGPGWYLTLTAEASGALPVGAYLADARVVAAGGDVIVTRPWTIQVVEAVTRP